MKIITRFSLMLVILLITNIGAKAQLQPTGTGVTTFSFNANLPAWITGGTGLDKTNATDGCSTGRITLKSASPISFAVNTCSSITFSLFTTSNGTDAERTVTVKISGSSGELETQTFILAKGTSCESKSVEFSSQYRNSVTKIDVSVLKDTRLHEVIVVQPISIIPTVSLTTAILPIGAGTITTGQTNNTAIPENTEVALTAIPNHGYTFASWSGNVTGTTNPTTITMDIDKSVTANFSGLTERTINVGATGCDGVSAQIDPTSINTDGKIFDGDVIKLTATETAICNFTQWNDGNTDNPRTITVSGDATYTATFANDITAPTLSSISPTGTIYIMGATSKTVTLIFNENIAIANATGITVNGVAANAPVINGNKITFDIPVNFVNTYDIAVSADAVTDIAGNFFAGLTSSILTVEECVLTIPYIWDKESLPCWTSWSKGAGSYNGNYTGSDAVCTGNKVIRMDSNSKLGFYLPRCGTFSITLGATGSRTFNLYVDGVDTGKSGTVAGNKCTTITHAINSCEPVFVEIINSSTSGGATISDISITDYDACYTTLDITPSSTDGSVSIEPQSADGKYLLGSVIKLTATPTSSDYKFANWTIGALRAVGDELSTDNPFYYTVDGTISEIAANFTMTTGIGSVNASKAIASETIYTLTGIQVKEATAAGIYTKKVVYEDGSVDTFKYVVK